MSYQVTVSPYRCAPSSGWRGLLTASTILIGLINPLLCVLYCALVLQHTSLDTPGDQRSRFYCDFSAQIATAYAPTSDKALAGLARSGATIFFGGTEGLPAGTGQIISTLALITWGAAGRHAALRLRALPPPVPPPRLPQGVRVIA